MKTLIVEKGSHRHYVGHRPGRTLCGLQTTESFHRVGSTQQDGRYSVDCPRCLAEAERTPPLEATIRYPAPSAAATGRDTSTRVRGSV